jgi:branched-chain amino acid transport system ATP-binding protein
MSGSEPLLVLDDVHCRRGGLEILHGISLSVGDELVTVLGLNASGKSTLLRTISGLTRTTGGTIHFDGSPIGGKPAHQVVRRGLAYMPQHSQVFASETVLDNLRLAGFLLPRARVDPLVEEQLDRFPKLAARRSAAAGVLSGGERQMLALAKSLMARPRMLLLDEPSAALAPVAIDEIYEILRGLRRTGIPMLMVEQNVRRALEVADRAVVLSLGRLRGVLDVGDIDHTLAEARRLMLPASAGAAT